MEIIRCQRLLHPQMVDEPEIKDHKNCPWCRSFKLADTKIQKCMVWGEFCSLSDWESLT